MSKKRSLPHILFWSVPILLTALLVVQHVSKNPQDDRTLLKPGPMPVALDPHSRTVDSRLVGQALPPGATNRVYLGNGWFTFEFGGNTYLYGDQGRTSVLSIIK